MEGKIALIGDAAWWINSIIIIGIIISIKFQKEKGWGVLLAGSVCLGVSICYAIILFTLVNSKEIEVATEPFVHGALLFGVVVIGGLGSSLVSKWLFE